MRGLFWLLAFTLVVRVGVLLVVPGALTGDPDGYRQLAENVLHFGTFGNGTQPTAYRPPLYPMLLVPCVALGGRAATAAIGGLHVLLALATVWLVWLLARRAGLGRWALLAGALVACDPILLGQSTLIMTETAATFFVALATLALARAVEAPSYSRCFWAGAALAACGLCRPELLLWAIACVLVLFFTRASQCPSRDREGGVAEVGFSDRSLTVAARISYSKVMPFRSFWISLLFGILIVLVPWIARNQIQFGRPIVTTTHGGYTLLLANNRSFYAYLREGKPNTLWDANQLGPPWAGKAHHASPAAELAADRRAYSEAWQAIGNQPAAFAHACLVRMGRFWALAPHQGTLASRLIVGACYLVEFVLAAVGLWVGLFRKRYVTDKATPFFHHGGTEDTERSENKKLGTAGQDTEMNTPNQSNSDPKNHIQKNPPWSPCLRGEFTCNKSVWLWSLFLAVSMTAIHAVYWSNMRMRGPLVPAIALAAAAGIAWWAGRTKSTQVPDAQPLID